MSKTTGCTRTNKDREHGNKTMEWAIKQFIAWSENTLKECQGLDIFNFSKEAYSKLRGVVLKYEIVTADSENEILKEFVVCPEANKRESINKKQEEASEILKSLEADKALVNEELERKFKELVGCERDYWNKVLKSLKKLLKSKKNKK
jgi:antirestriction protein